MNSSQSGDRRDHFRAAFESEVEKQLFQLVAQIDEHRCRWPGCERSVFAYYPPEHRDQCRDGDDEMLMGEHGEWHELAEQCWYCPEHPKIPGKGWLYEGSDVRIDVEGETLYGEVISFTSDEVTVKVCREEIYTLSPEDVSPV